MSLLTQAQRAQLLANGKANAARSAAGQAEQDFVPVVKLFTPDANATWLLTEIDPGDEDAAFGLCDLGLGCPEIGYVSLAELASVRGRLGLPVERDHHFKADQPLSVTAIGTWDACQVCHVPSDNRFRPIPLMKSEICWPAAAGVWHELRTPEAFSARPVKEL